MLNRKGVLQIYMYLGKYMYIFVSQKVATSPYNDLLRSNVKYQKNVPKKTIYNKDK